MKKTIAILPWDWIWEEVMAEAIAVLDKIAEKFNHDFSYKKALIWWEAYDQYGTHFPDHTKQICKSADAILFWSVGWPVKDQDKERWIDCEKNSILSLRKTFQFNANFRPVKVYPFLTNICPLKDSLLKDGIDILIIRELIWDIYFWKHETRLVDWERFASDVAEYSESQIKNIAKIAFVSAQKRKKKLVSIDKANVLDSSKLWRQVVTEVSGDFKDVYLEHMLVDNAAMQIIKNPSQFDLMLCPNMFWDILSDAAAVLPWSLWLMPSASLNSDWFWLYEPSWWSAPDIAWRWVANPIAQILSVAMCLKHSFWLYEESSLIELAVYNVLEDWYRTWDICTDNASSIWTKEMWWLILSYIDKLSVL